MTLPSAWADLVEPGDRTLWLYRELELPRDWRETLAPNGLSLWVGAGGWGGVEVWAGDQPVASQGLGQQPRRMDDALLVSIPPEAIGANHRLSLAMRWEVPHTLPAKHLRRSGPIAQHLAIGDRSTLQRLARIEALERSRGQRSAMVLVVFFVAIGLFHFHLSGRRRSSIYLWFSLTALDFAWILFCEHWLEELVGSSWAHRGLELGAHLLLVLLIQFLWNALGQPIDRRLRAYQMTHVGLGLFTVLVPLSWVFHTTEFRWLWGIPAWLAMGWVVAQGIAKGPGEERTIGFGASALVLCGSFEWIAHLIAWGSPFRISGWAFVLFAAAMAVTLAMRFHRVSDELGALRHRLEDMVADRASELSSANERLEAEIAERGLAEEAMRMLERAVEQSIDGILVTDLKGQIQFSNESWARMHGYEVYEVLGKDVSLFHTREQLDHGLNPHLEKVRGEGALDGEIGHLHKNGKQFIAWMSLTLLRDGDGEPIGFVFSSRDITEQREAEKQQSSLETKVRRATKLESLGKLAGGIAHDYNNLLTNVLGNASMLLRSRALDTGANEKVQQIELAAERAVELTNQLLAYAGEDPLVLEQLPLNTLLRDIEGRLEALVGGAATLHLELADGLPKVAVDQAQISRVVGNLVRNAAEAVGDSGGSVTVRTSAVDADRSFFRGTYLDENQPEGRYVRLEVVDDGCGIDDDTRSRIFDPFYSTRASARGLGLATVLGTLRAHQGAITVESSPGEGSRFSLLLPAIEVRETRGGGEGEPKVDTGPAEWRGVGKILVADDELLMREVSASILSEQGFEVLTAEDGDEALAIYTREREQIRLVLLDRTMPRMGGDRVLRKIRAMGSAVTVVMMSGFKQDEALRGLEDTPPNDFLQKPFRPDELLDRMRGWIQGAGE